MPWPLRMVLYVSILLILFLTYLSFRYFKSISVLELEPMWVWRSIFLFMVILFLAFPVWGFLKFNLTGFYSIEDFPHVVIYLFWFGFVFSGVMLNWLIIHDVLLPIISKISSVDREIWQIRFARSFLVIAGLTLIYTSAKMFWDTNRMTVENLTYNYSRVESATLHSEMTIVHITDIHADIFTNVEKMDRYIQLVNDADPDLVIFTGDLITEGIGHVQQGAEALRKINSTYGTFTVIGDHDYWAGQDHITNVLEENGIRVLRNEDVRIDHNGTPINLVGVTEIYSYSLERNQLATLINDISADGLKIVASHQSSDRLVDFSKNSGTNLLLSGHTHGGQLRIPVFFYPFTAVRSETQYVKGNWTIGNMLLNVNSGLGFTLSPVRYNAPAQVSVITVQ